jgi:hypothetical protein
MSTLVSYLVDDAAQAIGDPNKQRVQTSQWLSIYNRSNRELCQKANILKFRDSFKLVANRRIYDYPEQMTVMTDIHVSETPTDESSFRYLSEYFEDEFRERTSALYPAATLPTHYHATSGWFYLVPMVSADIVDGGCITYFGLPDRLAEIGTNVMQVDDLAQDYLIRRMIIHGLESRNRLVEARAALEMWNADLETLQDKLDDRSQDRRSSIAPRRNRFAGMH